MQVFGTTLQFFSFHPMRGDGSFADFNAVRDEFGPIVANAVAALVDGVNAARPGITTVNGLTAT